MYPDKLQKGVALLKKASVKKCEQLRTICVASSKLHLKLLILNFFAINTAISWLPPLIPHIFSHWPFKQGRTFFTACLQISQFSLTLLLEYFRSMYYFFTKVVSLLSLLSLTPFISNHQRGPSDVEPSYIPIFRLIQSAVGASKDFSYFMQIIDYTL